MRDNLHSDNAAKQITPLLRLEPHIRAGHFREHLTVIVSPLGAIDQRPALDSKHVHIVLYRRMRDDATHGHRQFQLDRVAGLPRAFDLGEAFLKRKRNGLAVDGKFDLGLQAVVVTVEVTGHRFVARPAGNTDVEDKRGLFLRRDGDGDLAVPRIARLLAQLNGVLAKGQFRGAAGEEIHESLAVARGIDVTGQFRQETGDIDGAAGSAKPRAALITRVAGERIRVEELTAVKPDAGEKAVVNGALKDIKIPGIAMEQEHALVPEGVGDGGAGLVVGGLVRQLVVCTERLMVPRRANTAGQI